MSGASCATIQIHDQYLAGFGEGVKRVQVDERDGNFARDSGATTRTGSVEGKAWCRVLQESIIAEIGTELRHR
jgi:hypothetical protein